MRSWRTVGVWGIPATLRDYFATSRGNDETFLVYEGERWSFADVMTHVDALAQLDTDRVPATAQGTVECPDDWLPTFFTASSDCS